MNKRRIGLVIAAMAVCLVLLNSCAVKKKQGCPGAITERIFKLF
jgi:hypothetical protein